jgi:hypothetical protein
LSKLHVNQIEGYLKSKLTDRIDMSDYAGHSDPEQGKKAFLSRALAVLATASLTEEPLAEVASGVTDGAQDGGIDLIHFDQKERTLYLTQSKWHDTGHGSIELGEALKFIDGVRKVLDNDLGSLNARVQAKRVDVESAVYDANAKFVLVLAHTGQETLSPEVQRAFAEYIEGQNDTSELMFLRVLQQSDLHKAVAAGLAGAPITLDVQLSGWGQIRDPHYAVYGRVAASDVAGWMQSYGPRLFERNLRQFLGGSSVNEDLVSTLKERPTEFWFFNNGITAIANTVAKKPIGGNSTDSGIFECAGFCVVNGAQTVGSIAAAAAQDPQKVAQASVTVRIISSGDASSTFPVDVTRYTNTQNAIEKRDFVALDPEQERLRQELHIEGVEYAYKAGTGTGAAPSRFDLTEATVALACVHPDVSLAVQAKREIGKLWDDLGKAPYKQIFNAGVTGPAVWSAVQRLRQIEAHLQAETQKRAGRDALICIHGNRFIQWKAMQDLTNAGSASDSAAIVQSAVERTIAAVRLHYPDSYPASLFKNLAKCRVLVTKL